MTAGAAQDELAIELRGLTKHYGTKRALDGIDLEVPAGSIFGFLGPNGAGKSTTINILTGLARPTAGEARILGFDALRAGNRVRGLIGYLPDVPGFYASMTAPEYLRFAGELFGLERRVLDERIAVLLDLAGLAAVDARIGGYSRGMRQRLGLAQAMINAPRLLLLDEPTSALDPMGRRAVLEMMRELAGRTTIFFSTHVLADVERVADRVAIIDRGRIVIQAETAALRARLGTRTVSLSLATPEEAARVAPLLEAATWVERLERQGATLGLTARDVGAAQIGVPGIVAAVGAALVRFETGEVTLEEAFISLVGERPA